MKQWKYFNVKNKYINRFKGTSFNIFRDDTHILITLKFLRYNKNNYALSDIITYFSQRIGNFFVSLSKEGRDSSTLRTNIFKVVSLSNLCPPRSFFRGPNMFYPRVMKYGIVMRKNDFSYWKIPSILPIHFIQSSQ